jgi:GntR family transcriptional regulator
LTGFADRIGRIDQQDHAPLYRQLQRLLRDAMQSHVLAADDALPAERDLADELGVSRITVRKALDGLVAEGLLTRRQGAGTFVAARVEKSFSKLSSFTARLSQLECGVRPREIMSSVKDDSLEKLFSTRAAGTVTPEESLTLSLSPGAAVYRFNRIRYADGAPMALEYSTVPAFALASAEAVETSLYEALEKTGHRPARALQRLRAVLFTPEQAELLSVAPRDPGLLIERRGFLPDGRIVEVTRSYYRGDAYDFVAELNAV